MEPSASLEIAKHTLLSGGLILTIGTLTGLLAQKIKIPDVAVFLKYHHPLRTTAGLGDGLAAEAAAVG